MSVGSPSAASTILSRSRVSGLQRGVRRPAVILTVILTCQLMVTLDATIVNIALPKIQSGLGFTHANLSWVINAYSLSFGGLLLLGARVGDVIGRKRAFLIGAAVFALASLVGGLAPDEAMLLAARVGQGAGGALATPAALALLTTTFPGEQERTRAIGRYAAVSIGGASIGLLAGGMLTEWASWRWVMFVNVPIAAVLIPIGALALTETPRHAGRFDIAGAVSATLGVTALVYGFVLVGGNSWSDRWALAALAVGVVLIAAYIAIEAKVPAPLTPLRLFTSHDRNSAYLGRVLLVGGQMGMFFFITQYLQDVRGYSAIATGIGFLPLTVISFVGSQLAARQLAHLFGRKTLTLAGIALSTVGLLWLTQLTDHSGYWSVFGPMIVLGFGNSAFVPLTSAALRDVEPEDSGAASGLLNVSQQVGGSLGLALLVTIFGTSSRHTHSPVGSSAMVQAANAFTVGATHAFALAAVMVAAAFVVALVLMRPAPPQPRPTKSRSSAVCRLRPRIEDAEHHAWYYRCGDSRSAASRACPY